jgi:hypothetical protein
LVEPFDVEASGCAKRLDEPAPTNRKFTGSTQFRSLQASPMERSRKTPRVPQLLELRAAVAEQLSVAGELLD